VHTRPLIGDIQMPQDGVNDLGIDEHADHLEWPAAAGAPERVGLVDAAQVTLTYTVTVPVPVTRHRLDGRATELGVA
jgi:hypothetical protein